MSKVALAGAEIFDGFRRHLNSVLLVDDEKCRGVVPHEQLPEGFDPVSLDGGLLAPGFIDLQVNGGGGVLFNDEPTTAGIATICDAHVPFGTSALLPTLITDTPDTTKRALDAGIEAARKKVGGFLGLHLEGPHLDVARKGAHRADYIRPMTDLDVDQLCEARGNLPNLLITIAPESVGNDQIRELVRHDIRISLGHTNTTSRRARDAFAAGAVGVTHLYNAMSGLSHREPGLVGAALTSDDVFCGLIVDGHHVADEAVDIALRSKTVGGRMFLVTDAMSVTGTNVDSFTLNDRQIFRRDGKLTLEDGTLAGADLDMISAVRNVAKRPDADLQEALRMAALYPAQCLGIDIERGALSAGSIADVVHLGEDRSVKAVWRAGDRFEKGHS